MSEEINNNLMIFAQAILKGAVNACPYKEHGELREAWLKTELDNRLAQALEFSKKKEEIK